MKNVVKKYTGIDFDAFGEDFNHAKSQVESKGIDVQPHVDSLGKLLNEVFEQKVESQLIQPTFVIDYPVEISPLARRHPIDKNFVQRF